MNYITYSEFFQFLIFIVAFATLIVNICNKK